MGIFLFKYNLYELTSFKHYLKFLFFSNTTQNFVSGSTSWVYTLTLLNLYFCSLCLDASTIQRGKLSTDDTAAWQKANARHI